MENNKNNHWDVPGKTEVEKQHILEHKTFQVLHRLAVDKEWEKFDTLICILPANKHDGIKELCRYPDAHLNRGHCESYYLGR